jgi:hypothetical protein
VHFGVDTDWYRVVVPRGRHSLAIRVEGEPVVGVGLTLVNAADEEVPMTVRGSPSPGELVYEASVEAGVYLLEVEQPSTSIAVTFDTSASVGPYLDAVLSGVRALGEDVLPGREAIRILPFDEQPLLDGWSDEPYPIQAAAAGYVVTESSSGAEENISRAAHDLASREGARAILVITDAASSSYASTVTMWEGLAETRPLVFALQTGGLNEAPAGRRHHLLQDWAASAGGVYRYARSGPDIARAFDRLVTWMRRPAGYRISFESSVDRLPPPEPGTVAVVAPRSPTGDGREPVPIRSDVAIEIILDTSGSMRQGFGGSRTRIELAKAALFDLVRDRLPAGIPVALRVFGDRQGPCATRLVVPLGPLDPEALTDLVDPIRVDQQADTPIGRALRAVPEDLAGEATLRLVVLITDSEERWPHRDLCGVNPERALRDLRAAGIDARVNVVGLAVKDRRARAQLVRWSRLGGGGYFDARDPEQFERAVLAAASAPFEVVNDRGEVVGQGMVGGAAVTVPPGTYVVVVLSEPEVRFDAVAVASGDAVVLLWRGVVAEMENSPD